MAHTYHTPTVETFKKLLKARGLKATAQRVAVHQAMMELGHASADMVSAKIAETGAKVTVASVYNILTQLALLGIYKHRLSSNNKMYFDVNSYRHIHLYDVYNHEYKDVMDEDLIETVEAALKKRRFKGYKVDTIDIQILCHPSHKKTPLAY